MKRDPRAVLTRAAVPPDRIVAYGDHPDQIADLRLPAGPPAGPLVLFFHGGFWRHAYDRAHVGPLSAALAAHGYPVATVEYRRTGAPGGGWPGTFDDVAAAVAQVPRLVRGPTSEPAPAPFLLAGHSAGGQLALWAAAQVPAGGGGGLAGVLALAPVTDLRRAYQLDLDRGAVAELLGGGPDRFPERYLAADPTELLPVRTPIALVHGDEDRQVPVAFSRDFAAAARAAGDQVWLRELSGVEHFGLIDPESAAWPAVLAALAALTGPRADVDGG
ncbi:MAG: alpha/beta hydrolase family protein [Micromonosporaceae bacterium]